MAYISFYRKWRPQDFDQIIGQKYAVKTLKNAIAAGRLAHSYMFCGPRGTGKTSAARILAKAVNCAQGPTPNPCNQCENCKSITNGTNVDILEIDAASNNGVEHIRELREKAKYIPSALKKKIYIVDEVHMLSTSAFNALLKVLEEPPPHIMFIMATTEPQKVLPTIMSRCQRFDFFPISVEDIGKKLKKISAAEHIGVDDAALDIIAKYAKGSLRDADGILEQLASFEQDQITVEDVTSLLGVVDYELLFQFADILMDRDVKKGLLFAHNIFAGNQNLEVFIQEFLDHLYHLYIFQHYDQPQEIVEMPETFQKRYQAQAKKAAKTDLMFLIQAYGDLYKQMKNSEGAATLFKTTLILTLQPSSGQLQQDPLPKSIKQSKKPASPDSNKHPAPPENIQKDAAAANGSIEKNWLKICNLVKKSKISVHAMFAEISAYRCDGNTLYFYLDPKKSWHKDQLSKKNNKDIIAKALKQVSGTHYHIHFETEKEKTHKTIALDSQNNDFTTEDVPQNMVKESGQSSDIYAYLKEKFEIKE